METFEPTFARDLLPVLGNGHNMQFPLDLNMDAVIRQLKECKLHVNPEGVCYR